MMALYGVVVKGDTIDKMKGEYNEVYRVWECMMALYVVVINGDAIKKVKGAYDEVYEV